MNYLELVNETLRESGITLDSLTSGTFASPPDPMFTKYKHWVAQSWEDIQTERRDWEYMQSAGVVRVQPKMEVYGCYSSGALTADFDNAVFKLHNSANADLFTSKTTDALSIASGAVDVGTAEGSLLVNGEFLTDFVIEQGDLLINSNGGLQCRFKRWAGYDLSQSAALGLDTTSDISETKLDSFSITDILADSGQSYSSTSWAKLPYIPYAEFVKMWMAAPTSVAKPRYFTLDNTGKHRFYPSPDDYYHIYFEYTKTPQTLSAYTDEPTGLPTRFHKMIVWRALMYWADYEGQGQQYNRAKQRYAKMENDAIRDLLPPVTIANDSRKYW